MLKTLLLLVPLVAQVALAGGSYSFGPGQANGDVFGFASSSFSGGNLSGTAPLSVSGGTGAVNGAGVTLSCQIASGSQPGCLSSADWTTFNNKLSAITAGNLTSSTTGVTVTGGTGAVIGSGAALSVQNATGSQPGLLTAADWTTFNGKQSTLTLGNLTGTAPISVSGGTGAVVGSGAALTCATATGSVPGCLSASDFTAFSNKLPLAGGTMTGAIAMGTNKITGLGTPTTSTDAATKGYVDSASAGVNPSVARYGFTNNGTTALTNNNPIIFDKMFFDPNSALDLTTGIWTAPSTGIWEFRLEIIVAPGNDYAAGDFLDVSFFVNGVSDRELYYPLPYALTVASGALVPMILTTTVSLTAGDLVKTNWVSNKAGAFLYHFSAGLEQFLFIKKISN